MLLRVFEDLRGGACEQQFGRRRAPQDLIHQVVGFVGGVGDAVAVQIKGAVVAPVVAAFFARPFNHAGANVHGLAAVVDEAVVVDVVVIRAGGEVDADLAVGKAVVVDVVIAGVVYEGGFVDALYAVAEYFAVVDAVEHDAVFFAVLRAVAGYGDAVGKHDDVGAFHVFRAVVRDFAVFGVHVVHAKAQVVKVVVLEEVVFADVGEDAVAPAADVVVADDAARAAPQADAVAAVGHARFVVVFDDVVFDECVFRPPDVDAEEVVVQMVVADARVVRFLVEEDARVHVFEFFARAADVEVFDGDVFAGDVDDVRFAVADDAGCAVFRALQGERVFDAQGAVVVARFE